MTIFYLCQVPSIKPNGSNVLHFDSVYSRNNYFIGLTKKTTSIANCQADGFLNDVLLPVTLSDCKHYDYLWFDGLDGERYFYFIDTINYHSQNTSRFTLTLDVFTTYQFKLNFLPSYVERCHVDRWESNGMPNRTERVNEGVESQYIIKERIPLGVNPKTTGVYIFSTSTPIGTTALETGGGGVEGDTTNPTCVDGDGNKWQYPTKGTISALFGEYPSGGTHYGLDIANNDGFKILSPCNGKVDSVGTNPNDGGFGYHVRIRTEDENYIHILAHMKNVPLVSVGQSVTTGTVLGYVGSTGNSTGSHCHWEIRKYPFAMDFSCCINPDIKAVLYGEV